MTILIKIAVTAVFVLVLDAISFYKSFVELWLIAVNKKSFNRTQLGKHLDVLKLINYNP